MKKLIPLLSILYAALSLARPEAAQAQLKANVEAIKSFEEDKSYGRLNGFYKLPGDVKGFTFVEFYPDSSKYGPGFFSKTNLDKTVTNVAGADIDIRMQAVNGSGFDDRAGLGINASTSFGPAFVSAYFIPASFGVDLKQSPARNALGYFVSVDLPLGITASSFGETNTNGPEGNEWCYGEVSIARNLGFVSENLDNITLSYNPAMQNIGPGRSGFKLEQRVTLTYEFK